MSLVFLLLFLLLVSSFAGGVAGYVVGYAHNRRRITRDAVQANIARGLR